MGFWYTARRTIKAPRRQVFELLCELLALPDQPIRKDARYTRETEVNGETVEQTTEILTYEVNQRFKRFVRTGNFCIVHAVELIDDGPATIVELRTKAWSNNRNLFWKLITPLEVFFIGMNKRVQQKGLEELAGKVEARIAAEK